MYLGRPHWLGGHMRKIIDTRQSGKTTRLLHTSDITKIPILCATIHRRNYLMQMAREKGLEIPTPLVVSNILDNKAKDYLLGNKIMVDDAEDVLSVLLNRLCNADVLALTMSIEEGVKNEHTEENND